MAARGTSSSKAVSNGKNASQSSKKRDLGGAQVPNRELLQRMNFLHQAAVLIASTTTGPIDPPASKSNKGPKTGDDRTSNNRKGKATESKQSKTAQRYISTQKQTTDASRSRLAREAVGTRAATYTIKKPKPEAETLKIGYVLPPQPEKPYVSYDILASKSRKDVLAKVAKASFDAKRETVKKGKNLSMQFVADIRSIARKSVLRIDPSVKQQLCRNCDTMLIPGITCNVRIRPSGPHVHLRKIRCLACGVTRSIPAPPILQDDRSLISTEVNMDIDANSASAERVAANLETQREMDLDEIQSVDTARPSVVKAGKRKASPIVKGRLRQYQKPRFHEQDKHAVWQGSAVAAK